MSLQARLPGRGLFFLPARDSSVSFSLTAKDSYVFLCLTASDSYASASLRLPVITLHLPARQPGIAMPLSQPEIASDNSASASQTARDSYASGRA